MGRDRQTEIETETEGQRDIETYRLRDTETDTGGVLEKKNNNKVRGK